MPAFRLAALLLCSSLGCLITPGAARAASFDSLVNGAWDSAATWQVTAGTDADGIPDADDAVTVDRTVTVSRAGEGAQTITVATASVLAVTGATASLALGSGGGTPVR